MSDLLSVYQSDFNELFDNVKKLIKDIALKSGEKQKTIISDVERRVDELNEILAQMEIEISNSSDSAQGQHRAQLRQDRARVKQLKEELRKAKENKNRRELLHGGDDDTVIDFDDSSTDQRQRLLSGTERLGESSRRLEASHRMALETESIGINILGSLKGQRETLTHARDTLGEADAHIDKSSRTLKTMARRMATNKIITGAIILILVVLIVLIIWSKLF